MKTIRFVAASLAVAVLAATLWSCDVFMASKLGRWNPLDPDNELVSVNRSLSPSVDGFLQDMAPERNFGVSPLRVGNVTPSSVILLKYEDLPLIVEAASLQLECTSVDLNGFARVELYVYPIRQSWSTVSLTYTEAVCSGDFYDYGISAYASLTGPKAVTVNLTALLSGQLENGNYGLLIQVTSGNSCEIAAHPQLTVSGKDIPD